MLIYGSRNKLMFIVSKLLLFWLICIAYRSSNLTYCAIVVSDCCVDWSVRLSISPLKIEAKNVLLKSYFMMSLDIVLILFKFIMGISE